MDYDYIKENTLVLLTLNRLELVKRTLIPNIESAGVNIDEIVWCDNGSIDGTVEYIESLNIVDKKVLNKENKGIAKGYNSAYKLATGKFVARPGTDMLMPKNWLRDMTDSFKKDSGIVAMISESYKEQKEKRYLGEKNGVMEANALGSIVFRKEILDKGIYLNDSLGMYGYEDTLWTEKVRDAGYLNYYIDGIVKDFPKYETEKYPEYIKWKMKQIKELEVEHPELLKLNKNING